MTIDADLDSRSPDRDNPVRSEHAGGPLAAVIVPVAEFNEPPEPPSR